MRPIKSNLNSENYRAGAYYAVIISIALIAAIIAYGYFLSAHITKVKKALLKKNPKFELTFSSMKTSGFVFLDTNINNAQIRMLDNKKNEVFLKIKNVRARNLIFTKSFDILIDKEIEIILGEKNERYVINLPGGNRIALELDLINRLKKLEIFFSEIILNVEKENLIAKNLSANIVKIITYDDVINIVASANIDSLAVNFDDQTGEKKLFYETNFELLTSILSEINSSNKIINQNFIVEKLTFNDITNNFALNVVGNVKNNVLMKTSGLSFELKITNYNSLIRTINDANRYFLIDKIKLSAFVELLKMAPQDKRNTVAEKYYVMKTGAAGALLINNVSTDSILKLSSTLRER
ncbi:MAG: hypothetical protein LBB09_02400 [Rickettsiales bacterium]|jgi:hypothetical protein|nr:hypothetical protein [Rickettsiales bacterium]